MCDYSPVTLIQFLNLTSFAPLFPVIDSPAQEVVLEEKVKVSTRRQTRASPPRSRPPVKDTLDMLPQDEHLVRRPTRYISFFNLPQ